MKSFEDLKNADIDSNAEFEGVEASVDDSNLGFLFDITSKQMYKDPIGSIVREITSNCFDAHAEVNSNDAVVIEFNEDDNGEYISFRDFGIGMSPDRFFKVYAKYFSSTKRDTNDQIGFFGLGSKSPFSYTDIFYVNTVYNKTKYEYIVHKGERKPKFEKILEYPTEEGNGTEVKIYLHSSYDKISFTNAIERQLKYFDNVYVKGITYNNTYQIIEGEHFKLRSDVNSNEQLHICIGKVYYPIDWITLGIKAIAFPVALKFNIGDLPVTPSRESIKYGSFKREDVDYDVNKIILDKIERVRTELQEMEDKRGSQKHNNLNDYYKDLEMIKYVKIGELQFKGNKFVEPRPPIYEPFENIPVLEDMLRRLDGHLLTFFYRTTVEVSPGRKIRDYTKNNVGPSISREHFMGKALLVRMYSNTSKFKRIKLEYLKHLRDTGTKNTLLFIKKVYMSGSARMQFLKEYTKKNKKTGKRIPLGIDWNYLKLWKYLEQVVEKEITLLSYDYDSLIIDPAWELRYKVANKRETVKADSGEVLIDDIRTRSKNIIPISYLKENQTKGFVIYGFEQNLQTLDFLAHLFMNGTFSDRIYKIYRIRQRDEKVFITLKNSVDVRMIMSDNPIFRKIANAVVAADCKGFNYTFGGKKTEEARKDTKEAFELIFTPLYNALKRLQTESKNMNLFPANRSISEFTEFLKELVEIAKSNNYIDPEVVKDVQRVEKYFEGLELINYINYSTDALPLIADFISRYDKPVNPEWKQLEMWQYTLLHELLQKVEYWKDLLTFKGYDRYDTPEAYRASLNLKKKIENIEQDVKILKTIYNHEQKRIAIKTQPTYV